VTGKITIDGRDGVALDAYGGMKGEKQGGKENADGRKRARSEIIQPE